MKEFIKEQNDSRDDPYGTEYYEHKSKDLIKKYSQHDAHLKKGFFCY